MRSVKTDAYRIKLSVTLDRTVKNYYVRPTRLLHT